MLGPVYGSSWLVESLLTLIRAIYRLVETAIINLTVLSYAHSELEQAQLKGVELQSAVAGSSIGTDLSAGVYYDGWFHSEYWMQEVVLQNAISVE